MAAIATAFINAFPDAVTISPATCRAIGATIETALAAPYTINGNADTTPPSPATGYVLHLLGADATESFGEVDAFGAPSGWLARRANTTAAAPSAIASGNELGWFGAAGYYTSGGTGYSGVRARMSAVAAENWTASANGSKIEFYTTPNGSTTQAKALTIGQDKSVKALGKLGYDIGVGGAVTQATSKATAITLNALCGKITLNNANLNSGTNVTFTWNNTYFEANDIVFFMHESGGTLGAYRADVVAVAGSATVNIRNTHSGALAEAPVLSFMIFKIQTA